MSTPIYADATDLAAWTGSTAPANADQLLRSASMLVRRGTATAFYAADATTGLPTDPDTLQAFQDATCAQAAFWTAAGLDPANGGVGLVLPVRSKRIGSAAVDYDHTSANASVTAYTARHAATNNLCPEAILILQNAGLFTNYPWITG